MAKNHMAVENLNRMPSDYAQFLLQFEAEKLKALQDAFLTGGDLTSCLEPAVLSSISGTQMNGGPVPFPVIARLNASLTTALCWSLAAPDILKPAKPIFPWTPTVAAPSSSAAASLTELQNTAKIGEALSRPATEPLGGVLQGERCSLQGWTKEWKGSCDHLEQIKAALSISAEELACNKHSVFISGHADFGLKRVERTSSDTAAIPYDKPGPRYYRTLIVLNGGAQPVVLLDICAVPSIDQTFVLHDDGGLAHQYDAERISHSGYRAVNANAVTLQPGAQYQVTVELRCSEQDFAWHQQWILFMFTRGNAFDTRSREIFVIGRRASALAGHNIQDVQKCLSTEAKPFYPAALRGLFDREPQTYEVSPSAVNGTPNWRIQMPASCQTHRLSVWPLQLYSLEEALYGRAALSRSVEELRSCDCVVEQLRQYSRLLALEETAMERDIKEYDLFSAHLHRLDSFTYSLQVPGLPENRPSVFAEDLVYIRLERDPDAECAAEVVAVDFQPKPRLILKLPLTFTSRCPPSPTLIVHVRFTFDRRALMRMHGALVKAARSSAKLLPCKCGAAIKNASNMPDDLEVPQDVLNGLVSFKLPRRSTGNSRSSQKINKKLNSEQWTAVESILDRVHGPGPYVILGPPGTGKTVTIVECVLQLLSREKSSRLLVCAPSNYAADILCSGIAAGGIDPSIMWRMNDPGRTMASIKVDVLSFCKFRFLTQRMATNLQFRVIVSTCGAAGMLNEEPLVDRWPPLTHILIDEAGQALVPEALIPFSLGDSNTCYVLCGDPKQLGPVVHSKLAAENDLDDTLLARFAAVSEHDVGSTVSKLVRNYRANAKLLELPSRLFYNNELIASAPASSTTPPQDWNELNGRDFPMLFFGVKGQQMREGESPSYFNPVEAGKVADLIVGLIAKTTITATDIGVMAPYRRQVQKLRLVLRSRSLGAVRVGTVDDYQGQEERVVFISTVLTRPESLKIMKASGVKNGQIGFLSNAKRFNVAITRAKAMLVVVGHPLVLASDENWSELLRHCLARDAFRGYGSGFVIPSSDPDILDMSEGSDGEEEADYGDNETKKSLEFLETSKAIERMADLALLGMGDKDKMYPVGLDSFYSAMGEETEWRIQL